MNISVFVGILTIAVASSSLALVFALIRAMKRISDINEQLLLLVGMSQQGEGAARALVAKATLPKRPIQGDETPPKPPQKPEGLVMKIGA